MPMRSSRVTHADRVFAYMKHRNRPLSAYEILDGLRDDGITAATTVYRALDKLHATGRVHRIESLNAWTTCCDPNHSETPVFEICDDCGNVTEHVELEFARGIAALAARSGFAPDRSVIEIHGRCSNCDRAALNARKDKKWIKPHKSPLPS